MSGQKFILFTSKKDVEVKGPKLSQAIVTDNWNSFGREQPVLLIKNDIVIVWEPDVGDYDSTDLSKISNEMKVLGNVSGIGYVLHQTDSTHHKNQKLIIDSVFDVSVVHRDEGYSHGGNEPYTFFVSAAAATTTEEYDRALQCLNEFFRPDGYGAAHALLLELLPDYLKGNLDGRESEVLAIRWNSLKREIEQQKRWDGVSSASNEFFDELGVLIGQVDGANDYSVFKAQYEQLYDKLGSVIER